MIVPYVLVIFGIGIGFIFTNGIVFALCFVGTTMIPCIGAAGIKWGIFRGDRQERIGVPLVGLLLLAFAYWLSAGVSILILGHHLSGLDLALIGAFVGLIGVPLSWGGSASMDTLNSSSPNSPPGKAPSATRSRPSPDESKAAKSPSPTVRDPFSGLSGEQLLKVWTQGQTLAALSLAQQDSAKPLEHLERDLEADVKEAERRVMAWEKVAASTHPEAPVAKHLARSARAELVLRRRALEHARTQNPSEPTRS